MHLQWSQGSSQPLGKAFRCDKSKMTRFHSHAFSVSTTTGFWYSVYECFYHIGSLGWTKTQVCFWAPKAGCESGNALLAHLRVASQVVRDLFSRPGGQVWKMLGENLGSSGIGASGLWFSNWKQYETITFPRLLDHRIRSFQDSSSRFWGHAIDWVSDWVRFYAQLFVVWSWCQCTFR